MKPTAVVLVSGGLDSCVTAAIAGQQHQLAFLHCNYRQRTQQRELKAFSGIADFYQVSQRLVVDLHSIADVGGSSLLSNGPQIPDAVFDPEQVPSTYVPFRNGQILAIAIGWAEVLQASAIFVGAVEADSSGYPDCRAAFFTAYEKAANLGTKPETRLTIETPLIDLSKTQIVQKGMELGAPLDLTWSCYQNEDYACGVCESCVLRLGGFSGAQVRDPIPYAENPEKENLVKS